MSDEEKKETTQEQEQKPSLVYEALSAAEALKKENEKMEQNIKQLQELKAFEMLGGKSSGKEPEQKPVEIDAKTYSEMVLEGKVPVK